MINVIIYEDDVKTQVNYARIIKKYFELKKIRFKFHFYKKYQKNLLDNINKIKGDKIYIFDIEVPGMSGLDLARLIRENGDWKNPLIVITNYDKFKYKTYGTRMLALDFISKKANINKELNDAMQMSVEVLGVQTSFTFQTKGEFFSIPYYEILYFEKSINDNYTLLVTRNKSYKVISPISKIELDFINNESFFKLNRSYIVNIKNITKIDIKNNVVYMGKYKIYGSDKEFLLVLTEVVKKISK